MVRALAVLMAMCMLTATISAQQDDCPPGHVKHPAVSPLDDTYMLAAFKASFRGIHGREPSCANESGIDDCWYYIRQSNHFGVYGDDQCHAGWSGYWESWIEVGHGDLSRVQSPARFLPGVIQPPQPPEPPPMPPIDLSGVNAQLAAIAADLKAVKTELIATHLDVVAVKQDTNWLVDGVKKAVEWGWKTGVIPGLVTWITVKQVQP